MYIGYNYKMSIIIMSEDRFNQLGSINGFNNLNGRDYRSHMFIQFMMQTRYKNESLYDLLVALQLEYEQFSKYITSDELFIKASDYCVYTQFKDELWLIGMSLLHQEMPLTYLNTRGYNVEILGDDESDNKLNTPLSFWFNICS